MKLYFIALENDDGESLDLHVMERTKAAALIVWRTYYELTEEDVAEFLDDPAVYEIDVAAPQGALAWGAEHCKEAA